MESSPALDGVRCIGEVTDLHQNSTALYFTLTDGDAELSCMIWANRYRNMDAELEDGREFYDEGQELLAEIRDRLQEGDGEVIEIE